MEAKTPKKKQIRWLPEHYAFIRAMYPTHSITQLSEAFEKKFGLKASTSAIGFKLWQHKIRKTPAKA